MTARQLAAVAVVAVCLITLATPFPGTEKFVDQRIYRRATEEMRAGAGYYRAMDTALRETNGPAKSVRAYREPAPFLLWRGLPSQYAVWVLFVVLAGLTGLLLLALSDAIWVPPLVVVYLLLRLARQGSASGWLDQFLVVELWVVPLAAATLFLARRGRQRGAAATALAAALTRELGLLLIVGGMLAALAKRSTRQVWPWLVAAGAFAGLYAAHAVMAADRLVDNGVEAPLWGTGHPPRTITDMVAWAIPGRALVGWIIWGLALWQVARDRELRLLAGPLALVPLAGLFVGRVYWGWVVAPLLVFWAGERLHALAAATRQRLEAA